MSERSRVARNTIVATAGRIATMLLGFAVTPTLLQCLGPEQFGILALIGSLQSYFGVVDLGIGTSISRYATVYEEKGNRELVRATTSFGLIFYVCIALCLTPLLTVTAPVLVHWLGVRKELVSVSVNALYIVFGLFIASSISGVVAGRVYAVHRMDLNTVASLLANAVYVASIIALVPRYPSIYSALACSALQVLTAIIFNYVFMRRLSPGLFGNPLKIPSFMLRQMFSFGAWVQVNSVMSIVNLEADKLIIGRFLGVASVAPYQVGNRLALLSRALPLQLLGALFPHFTAQQARGTGALEVALTYRSSLRALMLATLVIVGFLIAIAKPFMDIWLGRPLPGAASIAIALLVSYSFSNLAGVGATLLRAEGAPKYETLIAIFSAALNIGLTVLLVPRFGLAGVVAGTIAGNVAGSLLFLGLFHRLRKIPFKTSVLSWLAPLLSSVLLTGLVTHLLVNLVREQTTSRLLGAVVLFVGGVFYLSLLSAVLALFGFYEPADRALIKGVRDKVRWTIGKLRGSG